MRDILSKNLIQNKRSMLLVHHILSTLLDFGWYNRVYIQAGSELADHLFYSLL